MTSTQTERPSRLRVGREGGTPLHSRNVRRSSNRETRQELSEGNGGLSKPTGNGAKAQLGRTLNGFITVDFEELLEDTHGNGAAP